MRECSGPSRPVRHRHDPRPLDGEIAPDVWRVISSFRPGERGTKRLVRDWGHRLICVRYRYNPHLNRRIKTAEIVMDEAPWRRKKDADVGVWIQSWESDLRHAIVAAGGKWDRGLCVWILARKQATRLGLDERAKRLLKGPHPNPSEANIPGNRKANIHGNLPRNATNPGNRQ